MAKRCASTDLNHDNWDREEPSESAGTFQRAGIDVIEKRIIKVAKRHSSGITTDQIGTKNAFSGFQGLASDRSSGDLKSTFSFLKNCQPPGTNGAQNPIPTSGAGVAGSTFSNSSDDKIYPAKLIRLNQCVAGWIKTHVDKDPSCILTPIFSDYERYLKEIEEERSRITVKVGLGKTDTSSTLPSGSGFKFNLPTGNSNSTESDKTSFAGSQSLSTAKPTKTTTGSSLFSTFKTDNSKSSGISSVFSKPDPKSLMINPFTNKRNKSETEGTASETNKIDGPRGALKFQENTPAPGGFSFGSGSKMLSFGNACVNSSSSDAKDNDDNDGGQAEDSDEPPKVEFTPVKEDDALYNKRCKVFIKKDGDYADLGVTTLYIKPVPGEKHQLIVRADTSLGNVLVNVLLSSAIPTQRLGKNNVMIICVPVPPPAGSNAPPAPSTVLFRVKTSEEADELFKAIEKYKNKT